MYSTVSLTKNVTNSSLVLRIVYKQEGKAARIGSMIIPGHNATPAYHEAGIPVSRALISHNCLVSTLLFTCLEGVSG
jgi:hypothetical protein